MIKYAVYPFTGTVYDALNPQITAHHAQYDQTLVPVLALNNAGTDDTPDWQPVYPSLEQKRELMVVSRFQAKAALARSDLLDTVESLMASEAATLECRLAWQDAIEFRRLSPTMLQMAAALGLTDEQLDDLFELAATIEA